MRAPRTMTYLEHARDLRRRLLAGCLIVAVGFGFLVWQSTWLLELVQAPLKNLGYHLTLFKIEEALAATVQLALIVALLIGFPLWGTLIISFIRPALSPVIGRRIWLFTIAAMALACGGLVFAHLLLLPTSISFLLQLGQNLFTLQLGLEYYLNYCLLIYGGCAAGFQLPLLMLFAVHTGLVRRETLCRNRGLALVFIFIIAAILTPPDVVSQISLGLPLYALYELGLQCTRLARRSV